MWHTGHMNIAIVGFDTEGRSTYDFFANQILSGADHQLAICDQNPDLTVPEDAEAVLGDHYLDNLDRFDLIVRTAGMHPRKILDKNPGVSDKITTHINEFFKAVPTANIIGITGTKGKGTTSTLVHDMLEASGKDTWIGGNIGIPPLGFIDQLSPESWVVLELSSFQLIDLRYSPHIAACLMVVPEHLDWHADLEEYLTAKEQLFARQNTADIAVYFHDNTNSARIASAGQGEKIPYYHVPGAEVAEGMVVIEGTEICHTDEIKLLGQHNWQNACAAVTVAWHALTIGCGPGQRPDPEPLRQALTTFTGLEHRLEFVRELDGVKYYNDSFGTTPETAMVAIQAFQEPKVIILGGSDKGAGYDELASIVASGNVRHALLIGDQADRIRQALEAAGFHDHSDGGDTMEEIVGKLHAAAQPGDVGLLSTGCASFGMFKNYKDRGNQFKQAVQALPATHPTA